ncbi:MAG: hypothetical protein ABIB11_06510 [Candidatus Omnitrophota bacterium]
MASLGKEALQNLYFVKRLTLKQIAQANKVTHSAIAKRMDKFGLCRRNRSEATYNYYNKTECFEIDSLANPFLRDLALMLYWCEGTHYRTKKTLAFTNTNLDMLKIWLKFLKDVCHLKEEKIRIRLYLHMNQDADKLKNYWAKELKVSLINFENVSFTKKNSTKPEYKGTVKIKVHNSKLFDIIEYMIFDTVRKILF